MTTAGGPPRCPAVMLRMYCRIVDVGQALVVDDDVVAFRPVGPGVDRHAAGSAAATLDDERPIDGQRPPDGVHQEASL